MKIIALTRINKHGPVGINISHIASIEAAQFHAFGSEQKDDRTTTGSILTLSSGTQVEVTEGLVEVLRLANT